MSRKDLSWDQFSRGGNLQCGIFTSVGCKGNTISIYSATQLFSCRAQRSFVSYLPLITCNASKFLRSPEEEYSVVIYVRRNESGRGVVVHYFVTMWISR